MLTDQIFRADPRGQPPHNGPAAMDPATRCRRVALADASRRREQGEEARGKWRRALVVARAVSAAARTRDDDSRLAFFWPAEVWNVEIVPGFSIGPPDAAGLTNEALWKPALLVGLHGICMYMGSF